MNLSLRKLCVLLFLAPSFAAAANVVTDWSGLFNPTGNGWSYGSSGDTLAAFDVHADDALGITGLQSWSRYGAAVYYNGSGSAIDGLLQMSTSELVLAPASGLGGLDAVVEYTLPAAGDYIISGRFSRSKSSDPYSVHVSVQLESSPGAGDFAAAFYQLYWTGAADAPFSLTFERWDGDALQAGQRIRFVVQSTDGSANEYTGLQAQVMNMDAPEPGTLGLVSLSLAGLLVKRRGRYTTRQRG